MSKKVLKTNKHALHKYFCEYEYEAGIVLNGIDVRNIKDLAFEIRDSTVVSRNNELFLDNFVLKSYSTKPQSRKLLLHRKEIDKIIQILKDKKYHGFVRNIILTENNLIKVEIGLGKIKKNFEKKASEKRSSEKRQLEKMLKEMY